MVITPKTSGFVIEVQYEELLKKAKARQKVSPRRAAWPNGRYCPAPSAPQWREAMEGIEVIFTEEAYTSKASFLDHDPLPRYGEQVPQFSGKRVKRGMYKTFRRMGKFFHISRNGEFNHGPLVRK